MEFRLELKANNNLDYLIFEVSILLFPRRREEMKKRAGEKDYYVKQRLKQKMNKKPVTNDFSLFQTI